MHIGKKIKELRVSRNFSQEEIADLIHTSQSTYSRMEQEKGVFDFAKLQKLAEIYEVNIASFFEDETKIELNQSDFEAKDCNIGIVNFTNVDLLKEKDLQIEVLKQLVATQSELIKTLQNKKTD